MGQKKWAAVQSQGLNRPRGEHRSWDGPSGLSPGLSIPAPPRQWMWLPGKEALPACSLPATGERTPEVGNLGGVVSATLQF